MSKKNGRGGARVLRRALKYIGKYRLLLPVSAIFTVITVALSLYIPVLVGDAIDLITGAGEVKLDAILEILIFAAILVGGAALSQWICSTLNNRIALGVVRDIRNDAFERLERLPLSYHDSHRTGDTVNRIINDAEQLADGLLLGFTQLLSGILTIVITLGIMIYLNWAVALVVFVLTPISLLVAKFIASRTFNMFKLRAEAEAKTTSHVNEMLSNQKIVKAFSHEDESQAKFDELNGSLQARSLKAIFFSSLTNPLTRFVNSLVYAAVALVGALLVLTDNGAGAALLTVGELAALLSYANQYTKPFNEISGVVTEFQNALASAGRILEIIDEPCEIPDGADAVVLGVAEGDVSLSDVSFSYTPEIPLIEGISLEVTRGKRVAIVGPTGCGKTTLINLLMRFYDVTGGGISVDGTDIRDITRHSLRKNYGMVLQDTWLSPASVRDNIKMGKPDATDEEVIAAARAAHAHSFIKRLKNGYDTRIGEGGEELSQGQKQLICITRVMLCLPPMLILDEATSSIDTRTEIRIQKAFSEMMRGRTSFVVAHRLSTVMDSDLILVMRDGNIVETGTHEELLARGGFYFELFNSQFAK
ncbi:MAG: ABC transporter ATP-binding protein [Clostridia bacterium]|nr:ABC transporter ATP-binding protein [Clostridia bacterium]